MKLMNRAGCKFGSPPDPVSETRECQNGRAIGSESSDSYVEYFVSLLSQLS